MLSFFVIISPLFSFSWKRETLVHGTNPKAEDILVNKLKVDSNEK